MIETFPPVVFALTTLAQDDVALSERGREIAAVGDLPLRVGRYGDTLPDVFG